MDKSQGYASSCSLAAVWLDARADRRYPGTVGAQHGALWRDAGDVSQRVPIAHERSSVPGPGGVKRLAGWTGAGIAAVVALWLSAIGLGLVGTVAAGNHDAAAFAVLAAYAAALFAVVSVTAMRGYRRRRPMRVIIRRVAIAVLIAQIPAGPIIIAAMSM